MNVNELSLGLTDQVHGSGSQVINPKYNHTGYAQSTKVIDTIVFVLYYL